jgi:glucose-1-phosphate thymidylyltransferase
MVFFALEQLASAGLSHVIVVTGGRNAGDFEPLLGDGNDFGIERIDYAFQASAAGIADALRCAAPFVGSDEICLLLGDNLFEKSIRPYATRFRAQADGARVLLSATNRPEKYGIADMAGDQIRAIVEKPVNPRSNLAVTGCYFYDRTVFEMISTLTPSARRELEITDLNNLYLRAGKLRHDLVDGYWIDCGESFENYLEAANLVAKYGAARV